MALLPKRGVPGWAWKGSGSGEAGPGLRHPSYRAGTGDPQTTGSPSLRPHPCLNFPPLPSPSNVLGKSILGSGHLNQHSSERPLEGVG